jgi:hypothetical protein
MCLYKNKQEPNSQSGLCCAPHQTATTMVASCLLQACASQTRNAVSTSSCGASQLQSACSDGQPQGEQRMTAPHAGGLHSRNSLLHRQQQHTFKGHRCVDKTVIMCAECKPFVTSSTQIGCSHTKGWMGFLTHTAAIPAAITPGTCELTRDMPATYLDNPRQQESLPWHSSSVAVWVTPRLTQQAMTHMPPRWSPYRTY